VSRPLPVVDLSPCPPEYARLVGEGFDTVQEAFDLELSPMLVTILEEAQLEARAADKRLKGLAAIRLGDTDYKMRAMGTKGFRWQLETPDFLVLIASSGTDWPISIRYLAVGLWRHGVEKLRVWALQSLRMYAPPRQADFMRVSRADYAFDFHSPQFSREFRSYLCDCVVAPSGVKGKFHFLRSRGETFDIGTKATVQVELYNKTKQITDKNGLGYMYQLWAQNSDGLVLDRDVYRVEVRMGSEFLHERNILRSHELMAKRRELIAEALYTRRLSLPTLREDGSWTKRRSRWRLHPLWSEAIRANGACAMVPLGRIVTGQRAALVERSKKQIAGTLLAHSYLAYGDYNEAALLALIRDELLPSITSAPDFDKKGVQLGLRYSGVEDAA
jgi:hypothetical protein